MQRLIKGASAAGAAVWRSVPGIALGTKVSGRVLALSLALQVGLAVAADAPGQCFAEADTPALLLAQVAPAPEVAEAQDPDNGDPNNNNADDSGPNNSDPEKSGLAIQAAVEASAPLPPPGEAAMTDWLPREAMDPETLARIAPYCTGMYYEPELPSELREDNEVIGATADSATYQIDESVTLDGDVRFTHRLSQMSTRMATYKAQSQQVDLMGQVVYRQPGLLIVGEDAKMVLEPRSANVGNASFVLHESRTRGSADRVVQNEDGSLTIRDGYMTRCDPNDSTWRLNTEKVEIDSKRQFATVRNAVLRVGEVPVAYLPYLKFPVSNDRHSGLLFPTIGASGDDGLDFSVPYYLNLAPNYDATLTPRWLSNRGALMELEGRHLSEAMENTLGGAFLYRDDDYNGRFSRDEFRDLNLPGRFRPDDRWLLTWKHSGSFGAFTTLVDYAAVSDLDYFSDLGTDLAVTSESQLDRRAEIGFYQGDFSARLSALRIDPLLVELADPYQRLPDLALRYRHPFAAIPLITQLSGQVVQFERDNDGLIGVDQFNGVRWHVEPRLTVPLRRSYGHLVTQLAYHYTGYDLEDAQGDLDRNPDRQVAIGSIDAGLTFERLTNWFGDETRQTLEPRLYYLRVQRQSQDELPLFDSSRFSFDYAQLFRENRFSGVDRINDANQLSLAMTSRVLNAQGREQLRASFGRILHFNDRRVTLGTPVGEEERGHSPWAGEVEAALSLGLSLRGSFAFDAREAIEDQSRLELRYAAPQRFDGDQRIAYVGINRRGKNIREADAAIYWPLSDTWRIIGRWYYDLENERTLEAFGGIEVDACCYRVRVLARRYLKNSIDPFLAEAERGIFVQFVLKGLAGFGGSTDRILEHGIPGYVEDDYELR